MAIGIAVITILSVAGCKKEESDPTVIENNVDPNNFLAAKDYKKLTVELQYMSGHAPTAQSVENLRTFLTERLNKPDGITIVQTAISSPAKSSYSISDIMELEKTSRTHRTQGDHLTAYFLFLNGDYSGNSGNSKVLGVAYGSTSMAIFGKTVKDYSGGVAEPPVTALETTVILHEFGHILGLVNNGTPMATAHQDEPHGKHCNNEDCLMYYSAETTDIIGNLLGGNIPTLDSRCIDDLRANGGK